MMNEINCMIDETMRRPPEAPRAVTGPAGSATIVGHILHKGCLPGAIELGRPGSGSNHMMPLFIRIPVSGNSKRDPKTDSSVWVSATTLPSRSVTFRWVVQAGILPSGLSPICNSRSA